ncbi:MAG: tetratricopeptide repeat protein [Desulfovibrionales bacterium]
MKHQKKDPRLKHYEATVVEFLKEQSGCFVALTHDTLFLKTLNETCKKHLGAGSDRITSTMEPRRMIEGIKECLGAKKRPFLFVERFIQGKSTTDILDSLKVIHSDLPVIVLSAEVERSTLVFLYEVGAANFIIKPISASTLIEKMALTLKPQTKIGDLIEKARKLVLAKEEDEALKICEQVLAIKPNSAAALMIRGDAFASLGKKDKAVEAYKEAHKEATLYLEPLKRLAGFYRQEGDLQAQLEYLTRLDRLSPMNIARKLEIGQLYIELGQSAEAEAYFDLAIGAATQEVQNTISDVTSNVVEICSEGDAGFVEKFCRKALDLKKGALSRTDVAIFNKLGMALRRQGRWKEAVYEYKKALKLAPRDETLAYNIAMACLEGKQYREAMKNVKKALKKNPSFYEGDAVVAFNLGMIHYHNEDPAQAREYFKISLAADPNFQGAARMLSRLR